MKKYLLIFMGVLSLFFFCDSVNALSFTANGVETEVTSENYLFYIYYEYPELFEEYDYFFAGYSSGNKRYEVFFSDYQWYSTASSVSPNGWSYSSKVLYYVVMIDSTLTTVTTSTSSNYKNYNGSNLETVIYSNYDIKNSSGEVVFTANITKEDLAQSNTKPTYTITYYVNNELYQTIEVEEGSSHELLEYTPLENYSFSGWSYNETIDLSNITSSFNVYGTTTYQRPNLNYSEDIDSIIHELSVSIIGKNVPVEFDYIYTIMDFIILLVLVLCVIAPFIILIKLLSGRW